MSHVARSAPTTTPPARATLPPKHPQLALDLGGAPVPSGPDWESLPEASRAETATVLARLLAKAGLGEEESGA
jgi:hypothetical protein